MEIIIVSSQDNLNIILKELEKDDLRVEQYEYQGSKGLKVLLQDYQLTLALQCIQNCRCQSTYKDTNTHLKSFKKIVYPYAVVYIVHRSIEFSNKI